MDLKGKHVLVTGASRGVGRAIALACAQEGATVFLLARDQEALRKVEHDIKETGGQAIAYTVDVTVEEQVIRTIESIVNDYQSIDALINNAGRGHWSSIVETPVDTWTSVMDVNMKSTFMMCKYVLPHMYEQQQGHVVNISSVQAYDATPNASVYCASKAAMASFTKTMQLEAKPYNVKATSVAPSTIDTEFRAHMTNRQAFSQEQKARMLTPEDIADAVVGVLTTSPTSAPTSLVLDMHQQ